MIYIIVYLIIGLVISIVTSIVVEKKLPSRSLSEKAFLVAIVFLWLPMLMYIIYVCKHVR